MKKNYFEGFRLNEEITLRKLEIFLTFMETGNMGRAAEALSMSPVSIHRALHSLEEGLGCPLPTLTPDSSKNLRKPRLHRGSQTL